MKRTYEAWIRLKMNDQFEWNPITRLFEGTDDAWEQFVIENPHGRHFKGQSFFYEDKMRQIFPKYHNSIVGIVEVDEDMDKDGEDDMGTSVGGGGDGSGVVDHGVDSVELERRRARANMTTNAGIPFETADDAARLGMLGLAPPSQQQVGTTPPSSQQPQIQYMLTSSHDQMPPPQQQHQPQQQQQQQLPQPLTPGSFHGHGGGVGRQAVDHMISSPAKRARTTTAASAALARAAVGSSPLTPVVVDTESLNAAVRLMTESIRQVFEVTNGTLLTASRHMMDPSVSQHVQYPIPPTPPTSSTPPAPPPLSTGDSNSRFQAAVKLISQMRRDFEWDKQQYKQALAVLRQLDESGVILLLEMDDDAREDFILGGF
ncbi:uncharacterized protein V1518DRAFT_107020 [Limtongia smithiae]|uniref:uncharacterized protein n=1 Tax=Limtongia smithiae TaxID=1125753 RepID=UPI0034CE21D2